MNKDEARKEFKNSEWEVVTSLILWSVCIVLICACVGEAKVQLQSIFTSYSRFTCISLIIEINNNTPYLTQTSAYVCINLIKASVLNITGTQILPLFLVTAQRSL